MNRYKIKLLVSLKNKFNRYVYEEYLIDKLLNDGYVILPSVISNETCDKLKDYLDSKYNDDLPYKYYKGHYQINLPNLATI